MHTVTQTWANTHMPTQASNCTPTEIALLSLWQSTVTKSNLWKEGLVLAYSSRGPAWWHGKKAWQQSGTTWWREQKDDHVFVPTGETDRKNQKWGDTINPQYLPHPQMREWEWDILVQTTTALYPKTVITSTLSSAQPIAPAASSNGVPVLLHTSMYPWRTSSELLGKICWW